MYGGPLPDPHPRDPIGPGEFNSSDWFYNLTWMNCSVTWGDNLQDISVNSYFSGSSVYSYEQISNYKTVSGSKVTFYITGKAYVDTPLGHVDAESVKSKGTFDARTGTGTFTVTTSGY